MFADLRGSTALYEMLGNGRASALIGRCLALIKPLVSAHDGRVIKTLGDGLMAIFHRPSDALAAAGQMHDVLEGFVAREVRSLTTLDGQTLAFKLQIGIDHGEMVQMSGDYFGDAVNVAARLLDHASDNETLLTAAVRAELGVADQRRLRSLNKVQLRGRTEPVHVYLLETYRSGDTITAGYADEPRAAEPETIRLAWLDVSRDFSGHSLPVVLGRSPEATYCINDTRVSRSHARIDWHGGAFQLTDLSFNGSHVRFAGDSAVVSLRRGTCTLHGSGVIGLGGKPQDVTAPCVSFEILHGGAPAPDTHPLTHPVPRTGLGPSPRPGNKPGGRG